MPIYEFFCPDCNTVFNFLSRRPSTDKRPDCPNCGRKELAKLMSPFATIGKAKESSGDGLPEGLDESRMEQAMAGLDAGLRGHKTDPAELRLAEAHQRLGEALMENELWRERCRRQGIPLPPGMSKR